VYVHENKRMRMRQRALRTQLGSWIF